MRDLNPEIGDLVAKLRAVSLVGNAEPVVRPLTGGVSSDVFLVNDGLRCFVVKRALAKLRVREDWFADISRNRVEQAWLAYAKGVTPHAVPRLLHTDPDGGWFAMEYLDGEWLNWKSELLAGRADPDTARRAGATLGQLHAASWGDPKACAQFATLKNFTDLRIHPFLLATADRVPGVSAELRAEAGRLAGTQLALVHGDYSPKNLLVAPDRLVILDAEVAWFGDPAFDIAFLLTHLRLKALYHAPKFAPFLALGAEAWQAYRSALGAKADDRLEANAVRLTLCLLLARVHGKSPVEYLTPPARDFITASVQTLLPHPPATLEAFDKAWRRSLLNFCLP